MIDLSNMTAIRVDPHAKTATAAGGVLLGEFDRATQAYGLATTGGVTSHTGIAGLTLGGGLGHLMRKHGLTVDNLLAVDLVTADGELRHVTGQSEQELLNAPQSSASASASFPRRPRRSCHRSCSGARR